MRASYQWLKELTGLGATAAEMAERLSFAGLEVEGLHRYGEGLDGVVVAEVKKSAAHPKHEKLTLVTVFDGAKDVDVVCGASNVPAPGGRVFLAKVGATLPGGLAIAERKVGGVLSSGMLCSEVELDIGSDEAGIVVLDSTGAPGVKPGAPIADALGLRDVGLELSLTPNRPDALGHVGLARELCALFGAPFAPPRGRAPRMTAPASVLYRKGAPTFALEPLFEPETVRAGDSGALAGVAVDIADGARCPRYGAALVLGAKVARSPLRVRFRLHVLGLRALSNVVDATNLVLMEQGHPIHAFDLDTLAERRIEVRLARAGETMKTLDGLERALVADDLLICDGQRPVALAGVMGGENSEIRAATTNVLVECAYFEPRGVRRTSRRLGLHTDASHRFERGVDPSAVPNVLARSVAWIAELSGGVAVAEGLDVVAEKRAPRRIALRPARMNLLLGDEVPVLEAAQALRAIGCELATQADHLEVLVPTFRPDLLREVDLIEEVARVRGYDRIPTRIPDVKPSAEGTPAKIRFERRVRDAAAAAGLDEAVAYAFVAPEELAAARAPRETVDLTNPLSAERSVMRTSLLPGLAAAAARSERHGAKSVRLFEVGHTFHPAKKAGELPDERLALAILLVGERPAWIGVDGRYDFYDGKGALETIARTLVGRPLETVAFEREVAAFLHPRRAARVVAGGHDVGVVGELHPDVNDALGLTGRAVYAELSVGALFEATVALDAATAVAPPRFPPIARDVALLVAETVSAGDVASTLAGAGGALVESVELFDLYRGKGVPEGQRSLAFRVTYRDPEATLTDKQVDEAHARVVDAAKKKLGATVR